MTPEGERAYKEENRRLLAGPPPRPEKGDLSGWKPGVTFHFSHG